MKNTAQALSMIKRAKLALKSHSEGLLEIWLDRLQESDFPRIFGACDLPIIAVCRSREEKGDFKGSEKERIEKILHAVNFGAKFADIGMQTLPMHIKKIKKMCVKKRAKLIISNHIWHNAPKLAELERIFLSAKKMGAEIVKIAVFVSRWEDNVTLFELTRRICARKGQAIVIGMGERGRISRIGCLLLGSYLTYVALDRKLATAPGQETIKNYELRNYGMMKQ